MTFIYKDDPNVGKVHRERRRGTQHYLIWGWRGVYYRLTGRFVAHRNDVLSEATAEDGSFLWSNEDGDHFPNFVPVAERIWTETIDWRKGEGATTGIPF